MKCEVLQALLWSLFGFITDLKAQTPIPEITISTEFSPGTTFPNFIGNKNGWNAKLYLAGAFSVLLSKRLNKHWDAFVGIGMSAYRMNNRGKVDDYLMDFTSPHLLSGIGYYKNTYNQTQSFIKLSAGSQLGYRGELNDYYENYAVKSRGNGLFYFSPPRFQPQGLSLGITNFYSSANASARTL